MLGNIGKRGYSSVTAVKFSHEYFMKLAEKSTQFYGGKGSKVDLYFCASYVKIGLRTLLNRMRCYLCICTMCDS